MQVYGMMKGSGQIIAQKAGMKFGDKNTLDG